MKLPALPFFLAIARDSDPWTREPPIEIDLSPRDILNDLDPLENIAELGDSLYADRKFPEAHSTAVLGIRIIMSEQLDFPASLRDADRDLRKLRSLGKLASAWDKSAAWLGVGDLRPAGTVELARDLRTIYRALGSEKDLLAALSIKSFGHIRRAEFWRARQAVEQGLASSGDKLSQSRFLNAKANLASRLGLFSTAATLYDDYQRLAEQLATAPESLALAFGSRALAQAYASDGKSSSRQEQLVRDSIESCLASGHLGFALQLNAGLIEFLASRGTLSDATEQVRYGLGLLADSNLVLPSALEKLRLWSLIFSRETTRQSGRLDRCRREIMSEDVSDLSIIEEIKHRELRSLLARIPTDIANGESTRAAESLCLAAEYVTQGLLIKHSLVRDRRRDRGREPSLVQKVQALRSAQALSPEDIAKFNLIATVRNQLFHGRADTIGARRLSVAWRIIENLSWLCRLVKREDLNSWTREEDSQLAEFRVFLERPARSE